MMTILMAASVSVPIGEMTIKALSVDFGIVIILSQELISSTMKICCGEKNVVSVASLSFEVGGWRIA